VRVRTHIRACVCTFVSQGTLLQLDGIHSACERLGAQTTTFVVSESWAAMKVLYS